MKVALTGGSSGIGAATATKFKDLGHHVTAFDIAKPADGVDEWIETDLGDPASIDAAVAKAGGPFDVLVNNAGLPPREGIGELVLKVNFLGFRRFLEAMLDNLADGAAIVNTASRAGAMWRENIDEVKALMALESAGELPDFIKERSIDHVRAYNLSKEAVIVYTVAGAERMIARGLRMNSVSPAAVSTDILEDFTKAFGERVANNIARVGRPSKPEEVADVICFLASGESAWLKGVDITIDGGMSALAQADAMGLTPQ